MPPDLNGAEADAWREFVPLLAQMGVLTLADGDALGAMCRVKVRMSKALMELAQAIRRAEDTGRLAFIVGGEKNAARGNPLVKAVAELEDEYLRWLREFGLTPSSRTRIMTAKESAGSDIEDALCA
jgi:P27 family predicted phage terminase small subunit